MNHSIFYGIIREKLFRGKLTQGVADTLGSIVDTYYAHCMPTADPERIAGYYEIFLLLLRRQ